jgi:hypothetical protein
MKYFPYYALLVLVFLGSCNVTPSAATMPNNMLLAFTSEKDGNPDIFTMWADGSNQVNLTNNPARDFEPAWSPDGKKIFFISERTGEAHIFSMNLDGSNVTQLTDDPGIEYSFSWSPDGTKIGYASYTDPDSETGTLLIVMNPDGSNKTVLAEKLLSDFDFLGWSPDSQYLVYRIWEGYEQPGLYVVHVDGSRKHRWPELSLIERKIYWMDRESFIVSIFTNHWKPARWVMHKLGTDGSQIEINTHETPIVAIFDKTYVVESRNGLNWFTFEGNLLPSAPFEYNKICELPENEILGDPDFYISPDRKHAVVTLICSNTASAFFLVNEDGSMIQQMGARYYDEIQFPYTGWSPDSRYATIRISNHQLLSTGYKSITEIGDIYLLDIQKLLNDPSAQLIKLTTDGTRKYDGAVWQPQP